MMPSPAGLLLGCICVLIIIILVVYADHLADGNIGSEPDKGIEMQVTYFKRPDGRQRVIDMLHIHPEDEKWLVENNVKVSIEDLSNGTIVVYGDCGIRDDDDEPVEILAFDNGRDCFETMKDLRQKCEKALADPSFWKAV